LAPAGHHDDRVASVHKAALAAQVDAVADPVVHVRDPLGLALGWNSPFLCFIGYICIYIYMLETEE